MSKGRAYAVSTLAAVIALALPANAQSVISIRSGVIHYFEGAVYLGDQFLESHLGTFPSVPVGGELRTAEGRAEVLLTPGAFLRMGEGSAIRMVANDLADTQVELLTGSAMVDSGEPNANTSVTLIYQDWRVHLLQKGVYRIDSDPPRLSVSQGQAEVFAGPGGQPIPVGPGMSLPFGGVLVPERSSGEPGDALGDWAHGRDESIAADNAITAQIDEDPASGMPGVDGFTYFPFLGVLALGPGASPYSSFNPYQAGFSSIYLPGYTYRPLMLGLTGHALGTYRPSLPRLIGIPPRAGALVPVPRTPVPVAPLRPPAPVHAPSPVGVRVGGHR